MKGQYLLVDGSEIYRYQAPMSLIEWNSFGVETRSLNVKRVAKKFFAYRLGLVYDFVSRTPPLRLGRDIAAVWGTKLN